MSVSSQVENYGLIYPVILQDWVVPADGVVNTDSNAVYKYMYLQLFPTMNLLLSIRLSGGINIY